LSAAVEIFMTRGLLTVVVVHILCGCVDDLVSQKLCTERGCGDSASVTVRREGGTIPPLAVVLDVDGRRVTCPAPIPGGRQICDDSRVSVTHYEQADCTETLTMSGPSESCKGNGRFAQRISLVGTPKRLVVTLSSESLATMERIFEPTYKALRPNGEGCEPLCQQWSETWVIPSS
jgi:hypothetical protein